ncbi:stage II sporulation protein P [Virgibacillus profundi]|uniref:Stage II sporulation protein P n=1 Tax=Virgibacillus profundi TaxID=2024555 RepID=A0A2A2IBA6_9BACI|nr:stage II sporulation protein P [Virgibacillus profundi]PAV29009.1 stage II sporulation protein P [Virgibacillus profundi]PXY53178.1 stage II sporulation protein P [Virgibacillus profundi]
MLLRNMQGKKRIGPFYKKSAIYIISMIILFLLIGILTTIKPAYRFSSDTIAAWTSDIDSSIFLYLLGMENKAFEYAYPEDNALPDLSNTLFQIATSIKPNDPRSLLGNELPGFSIFDSRILIAGEGTNYTNLPFESSPPLEEVLKEREAVVKEEPDKEETVGEENLEIAQTTGERDVVFIYNTHNRESFLPHLPGVSDPNSAHHKEVNITNVSDRLEKSLEANGIGTNVDDTDVMNILNEKGWLFGQAYKASRDVVKEAFNANKNIQFVFDLHRDSVSREHTTKEINGESYAKIMIVVGLEHPEHEKNLKLASELHDLMQEKYPGLSRGVYPKQGPGMDGVYNQDLSENSLVLEFGGVENNLEELYRSADAFADVFSELYWDAEKVDANP